MSKPKLKQIKAKLQQTVKQFEAGMAEFQAKLSSHPVHAFRWADTVMSLTARQEVAQHYLTSITTWQDLHKEGKLSDLQPQNEEAAVEFIYQSILTNALRKNRFTSKSTSACSNLMEEQEAAFYAELADEWNQFY